MTKIGLLSDTHSFLDESVFKHFELCDEVWHAGDFGNEQLVQRLQNFKPLRGVWGNIDSGEIRKYFPEMMSFQCEGVGVTMLHIGGYPNRYSAKGKELICSKKPNLFISGHSHILKIMYDPKYQLLHINPGAAGKEGWHQVRTLVRFSITEEKIHDMEIIELEKR